MNPHRYPQPCHRRKVHTYNNSVVQKLGPNKRCPFLLNAAYVASANAITAANETRQLTRAATESRPASCHPSDARNLTPKRRPSQSTEGSCAGKSVKRAIYRREEPALVFALASLVFNWAKEIRFTLARRREGLGVELLLGHALTSDERKTYTIGD